ncbi:LOW QUALITY PROTEIN: DNA mismatch repair protein Mlh3 [Pristis pectinata]|uniref:LOW QUALITY PROTEIN: DNA mismatch repair protein Mlh3 n=1 Tax=Pristis pectinata TaxID=685728 RepID=UPI00223DE2D8|nr:LOW QUALITY PROTEIN: DNA mismatch repair protein Mlh3 [Pristis pectinata]
MEEAAAVRETPPPPRELRLLSPSVQAGLRSAVKVPSLAHCLEELLLNSLAAGCGCAAARVNAQVGRVQVADNGAGLERATLELAGARYHSSRAAGAGRGGGPRSGCGEGPGAGQGGGPWSGGGPGAGRGGGPRSGYGEGPGAGQGGGPWSGGGPRSGYGEGPGARQGGGPGSGGGPRSGCDEDPEAGQGEESEVGPGCRGEALASIAHLSGLLEIVSRPQVGGSRTWVKLFRNGQARPVYEAVAARPSPGTTVTVCNLFYRLPVRRRRMVRTLEWEQIRRRVQALSLLHPGVSFTVRNEASATAGGSLVVRLPKASSLPARFAQIYGTQKAAALGRVQHSNGCFQMSGFISRQGHHTKAQRLVFVNGRLVLKTRIHVQLDLLIRRHSLICRSGPCIGSRGGPDLHPVYVINVSCDHCQYDACWETGRTLLEFTSWDLLLNCLEEGVRAFLLQEKLLLEPTEEQETPQLPLLSSEPAFSHERAVVQSKSVHRQAVLPENSSGDAVCQGVATVEKVGVLGAKGEEPALQHSGTVPHSTEAPRPITHIAGQEAAVCGKSLWEEMGGSSPLTNPSTSGSPETQPAKLGYPNTESVLTKGDGIYQLAVAYESETSSSTNSSPREGVQITEGEICELHSGQKELLGNKGCQGVGVEFGVTGLITHVIPMKMKTSDLENGNFMDWGHVFHPGPVSAWDVNERLKEGCSQLSSGGKAHLGTTRECGKAKPQRCIRVCRKIQGTSQYCYWSGSHAKSVMTPGEVTSPKDCANSKCKNVANCEPVSCQARFHRKLTMSLITGSLDAFRREYARTDGQDGGSSSQGTEVTQHGTGNPAMKSTPESAMVVKEADSLNQNLNTRHTNSGADVQSESLLHYQCDCDGFQRSFCARSTSLIAGHVPKVQPSLTAQTTYSQAKKITPIAKEPPRTLAAKLSRLKHLKKESWEFNSRSFADCSPPCQSPEGLLQPEKESPNYLSTEPMLSAAQLVSENCAIREEVVGEECQGSCRSAENKSDLGLIYKGSCSEKSSCTAAGERTVDGTVTQPKLHLEDQSQRDGATEENLNQSVDTVASCKESDPICIHTKLVLDGADGCVETCEGDDTLKGFSSEWLQYFDGSLGKTVFVNSITGVSSYELPPESQTRATCTKDFTTMAVNVLTKTGFPYRCYPFRSENLIPFLPRPREERQEGKADEGASDGRDAQLESSDSLRSLFLEWRNPVFLRPPEVAIDVSNEQADGLAVKIHNILYPYRFTKDMISSMQVLNQVDNKFIACLINTRLDKEKNIGNNLLVLVDQHAAHERVRLEQLISDSYETVAEAACHRKLCTSTVCPPMEISCTQDEAGLLRLYWKQLEAAGVQVEFRDVESSKVLIRKVPACFVEREATEVRRGRQPVTQTILQEFLREQIEVLQSTGGFQGVLSRTVLKVLSSQACHGAVKFGDALSVEECRSLINSLASCHLPFQCAHGRPSILPLADLDHLDIDQEVHNRPNLQRLRTLRKAWASCEGVQ